MAEMELKGVDVVSRNLEALLKQAPQLVAQAMREEAEVEMTEAKQRTPVDTGALRASGHVEGPTQEDGALVVRMKFGGPSADYAVFVHEDLEAHHVVGQAKFLESVVLEAEPHMADRITKRAAAKLARTVGK